MHLGGLDPDHQFIMHISKLNASGGNNHPAPLFRGLRTKTHTFAEGPNDYHKLFDNKADPFQMNNLAADTASQSMRRRFADITRAYLDAAEDGYTVTL